MCIRDSGWAANGHYFQKNVPALNKAGLRCLTIDHRGMGDSGKPGHGHRVSRIAADVQGLLQHVQPAQPVVMCGVSLGFTIISLFLEIYGDKQVSGACFVDQTCAMYQRPGWYSGALELNNPSMCADLVANLEHNFEGLAGGIVSGGFGEVGPDEQEMAFMKEQVLKCDPVHLGRLMEDHANLDMRDLMPQIQVPVLNCIGGQTKCHEIAGMEYIGHAVPRGKNAVFDKFGHFLYWEDPKRFNQCLIEFTESCNSNAPEQAVAQLVGGVWSTV
eukprot:TRINITY_DN8269_c0_g1_i1.p1 TRINITY_DN8269_c0_g1~~TRINITY_DN8269_c0_g1_i1.p1  ORF type:complete len:273 (+),score=56.41 TRINITY_DN8269_c0_g1_i1:171-989(+)